MAGRTGGLRPGWVSACVEDGTAGKRRSARATHETSTQNFNPRRVSSTHDAERGWGVI